MVRVLIDATALPGDRGGVGRYVDELVAALPGLGVDLVVAAQPRDLDRYAAVLGAGRVLLTPGWAASTPARLAWEQVGLPALVARVRPDVVHSPHYTLPLVSWADRRGPAQVVTLHDATFFSHPELHLPTKARFFGAWTRASARLADALVVPSVATRDEVVRRTAADPSRITVIPHAVDHDRFRPATPDEVARVRTWLDLDEPRAGGGAQGASYVAFLGTLEPRKNVPTLVRAWVQACAGRPDPPALVLAGGRGWDGGVDAALAEVPAHLTVRRPGFVPDDLVPALLGGADLVAYPAFGEGFGLPVLEAMACGAAVLTTPLLSLPEVGGDAVAYAASPDLPDVAAALTALLDDPGRRTSLSERGLARAAGYTWAATAAQHAAVYEKVSR